MGLLNTRNLGPFTPENLLIGRTNASLAFQLQKKLTKITLCVLPVKHLLLLDSMADWFNWINSMSTVCCLRRYLLIIIQQIRLMLCCEWVHGLNSWLYTNHMDIILIEQSRDPLARRELFDYCGDIIWTVIIALTLDRQRTGAIAVIALSLHLRDSEYSHCVRPKPGG